MAALIATTCGLGAAPVAAQEVRGFFSDSSAALARLRSVMRASLEPAELQRFDSVFLAMGANLGKDRPTPCSSMSSLAYTWKPDVDRADGLDGVIELCTANLWFASQLVTSLSLIAVADADGLGELLEPIVKDVVKEQQLELATVNLGGTSEPPCPPIYVAYLAVRYRHLNSCRDPNGVRVIYQEAAQYVIQRVNARLLALGVPDAEGLSDSMDDVAGDVQRMQSLVDLAVFDVVALHEAGHLIKGHHRLGAAPMAVELAREVEADAFSKRWHPSDAISWSFAPLLNLGLAAYVAGHQELEEKSGTALIELRVTDKYYSCAAMRIVEGHANEGDRLAASLLASFDAHACE